MTKRTALLRVEVAHVLETDGGEPDLYFVNPIPQPENMPWQVMLVPEEALLKEETG